MLNLDTNLEHGSAEDSMQHGTVVSGYHTVLNLYNTIDSGYNTDLTTLYSTMEKLQLAH